MGGGASCASKGDGLAAGKVAEFDKNTSMKEVKLEDGKSILVVKTDSGFYAVGSKCTHYGAPLIKGNVSNGQIRCPWHGACFNLANGDIEQFPGFDSLPSYPCKVKGGTVYVYRTSEPGQSIIRPLCKMSKSSPVVVIIGSGASAVMCAQTLRQEQFPGRIVLVTKDKMLPYDRPKLSKAPGSKWDEIKLRDPDFFHRYDIEIMLDSPVSKVRFPDRTVVVDDGKDTQLVYDKLLIASGLRPRSYGPVIPGGDLKNIITLYNMEDASQIASQAAGKDVLICGSSFIAMELATSLKSKANQVNIIGRSRSPYGIVLGPSTGKAILNHLLEGPDGNKVRYWGIDEVKSFEGNDKNEVVKAFTMKKKAFDAQLVILAIGAIPNTDFLEDTPIRLNQQDGAVCVNKFLETSVKDVYAAGDVTQFPTEFSAKGRASICHWGIATHHGKLAAQNMLGKEMTVHQIVPFFWTAVAGVNVRYAGYGEGHSDTAIFGSLESMEFCTLYRRSNKTLGIATVGCDPLAAQMADELQTGIKYKNEYPITVLKRFPKPPVVGE
ncbi:unnamed protein product [Allacma fusca]|uniref:Rieske domain-containing protein n=1 Tax=Allacma fusca TaxID=39272 RepID=A0A8J2PL16_9HEXA|nr:unnamed protein product [Allacma fusca]